MVIRSTIIFLIGWGLCACDGEPREQPAASAIWSAPGTDRRVSEPVAIVERSAENRYALPGAGATPIAELLARLPGDGPGRDGYYPGIYHSDRLGENGWSCPLPPYKGQASEPVDSEAAKDLRRKRELETKLIPQAREAADTSGVDALEQELSGLNDGLDVLAYYTRSAPWSAWRELPDSPSAILENGEPVVIEGAVTLHPRQYIKAPVCGQGERNYGAYVVEDDTGGIVVLRDSRIAPFNMGDRVRVTLDAVLYPPPGLRNLLWMGLTAQVDIIQLSQANNRLPIVYSTTTSAFSDADVGLTKQIDGFVVQKPSNSNFSELILGQSMPEYQTFAPGVKTTLNSNCQAYCEDACRQNSCGDPDGASCQFFCDGLCRRERLENERDFCTTSDECNSVNLECQLCDPSDLECAGRRRCVIVREDELKPELPQCWTVNLDRELVSRGYTFEVGQRLKITGPVVNSYGLKLWVQRLGQIEDMNSNE
ncbi:MAG: hypothetical protein VX589_19540 [Myxococcota bacterium]|nr:hypothetical protein [Myxococcota bacterium]